jgi:Methyltransferase domain
LSDLNYSITLPRAQGMPRTIAERTRRVYDSLSAIYPASTFFFHSKAHTSLLSHTGIQNGMQVLEIATGSGEMFRRLVKANPDGKTFGLDLSPNMAARTQRRARKEFPSAEAHCGAVDVRNMPFRNSSFDAVVCCYLLELLGQDDICGSLVPAFWGRQVERSVPSLINKAGLKIVADDLVRQTGYPSRVLIAKKK